MSNEYVYEETVSQPYNNCKFSAGFVEGHPVDTLSGVNPKIEMPGGNLSKLR